MAGLIAKTAFQRVQPNAPELPKMLQPTVEGRKAFRVKLVNSALRLDPDADELGVLQHLQMLRHGRSADREPACDLARRQLPLRQHLHDASALWVGECNECPHTRIL